MSELVPDAAVRAIQDSVDTEVLKVGNEEYTTRLVYLPPKEPQPDVLGLHTLTGLVTYFDDALENEAAFIHVEDFNTVNVLAGIDGRHVQRDVYVQANSEPCAFQFGVFRDCETFVIGLQSCFVRNDSLAGVLRVVGNIKEEGVKQISDDGVTQTVTARAGIVRVEDVEVPNPVTLKPWRTFREVEQPASEFVLRMKQGHEGQMPQVALFEADGAKWKLDAIQEIRAYLAKALPKATIIA